MRIEMSWDGEVLWEWIASDYIDELDFSEWIEIPIGRG
jgi:hypothetical protein